MTRIIYYILLFFIIAFIQTVLPAIIIFQSPVTFDLLLIFLTVIALQLPTFSATILGFFIGLLQDITTQHYLLGSFSFMKSISGYAISWLTRFDKIWNRGLRYLFILGCYVLHYSIYYYIRFAGVHGEFFNGSILVSIHALLNLFLLWFIDRFIFSNKLV